MRAWQIIAVGTAVLLLALLVPVLQGLLLALIAAVLVAVVLVGFLLRPRRELFILKTTVRFFDTLGRPCVQHEQIAVKIELVRLWMLFLPTFAAVAFLVAQSAHESRWVFELLDYLPSNALLLMVLWRLAIILCVSVIVLISAWITERWILRDANACTIRSASRNTAGISYAFTDAEGSFYGGTGVLFGRKLSPQLSSIVLYRLGNPDLNKLAMGCVFHKAVIVAHGINDLDELTAKAKLRAARWIKGWAGQGA